MLEKCEKKVEILGCLMNYKNLKVGFKIVKYDL